MKVLFLLNGLTHYFNSVLNQLNNKEEIEIIVVSPSTAQETVGKGVYQTTIGINFKIYQCKEVNRFYRKKFFNSFEQILDTEKPEVIVFIWPYILEMVFNPILLLKIKRKKIKIIFKDIPFQLQPFNDAIKLRSFPFIDENQTLKGVSLIEKINNLVVAILRRYYYSFIDLNLLYIEDGMERLISYGVPSRKIAITLNSPDTNQLIEAKKKSILLEEILPENPFRIIHVGRLVKWKRVDLLIEAIAKLISLFNRIELVVIGGGPELNNLKTLAKKLNVEDRIIFVGSVYDPVLLGQYFYSSSIYVLAGMGGLSINEAMVFEKPIICSICDGTERTLVKEGYNGYFFDNGDLNSLIEKIILLLSDKKLIEKFGKNSFQIIQDKVNINTVVQNYYKAFLSINNC